MVSILKTKIIKLTWFYLTHLHLQSGEQFRFALPQLHFEQSPLHDRLMSSLHALETSGVVI